MNENPFFIINNCQEIPLDEVPQVLAGAFRDAVVNAVKAGARLSALFAIPHDRSARQVPDKKPPGNLFQLFAIIAYDEKGALAVLSTKVSNAFASLTPDCPQAHWFEREIYEQWGILPERHPWLKPIRFHKSYRNETAQHAPAIGITDFFHLDGAEVHEVAVGPVHAGIIEPGHFRFQCHGEDVYHLEISLGYQHRGIEPALIGPPSNRIISYMETLAGDTTIGHATAYAQLREALSGFIASPRALAIRGIALELERIANHTGDLGALAGDVGYLPTASYCGRIRGDFLNMTALLCGSRFGRGLIRPGGILFDLDPARIAHLRERLQQALKDVTGAVDLLWDTPSVMARFENTGTVSPAMAEDLGLVGPAARACGIVRDTRFDFPSGIFQFGQIPVSIWEGGDVFARAYVRWLEIQRSITFIQQQLEMLPDGNIYTKLEKFAPGKLVVSLVEGWRGEICHVAITDTAGGFSHYKLVDPSFHNWMGLSMALRNQQISDFPLCNKSFNLSYSGHDL